jgi:predicted N-acetyltransferase YhbS
MTSQVRTATPADAHALARLINDAFAVERFFKRGDRTSPAGVADLMAQGEFLIVDDEHGAPVACVYVKRDGTRGYFGMLSVDPRMQGHGLGRGLIEDVETRLRIAGCEAIDIYVINLRTELLPFYRKLGYVESGTRPFPDPGEATQPCHVIVMTKALT